MLVANPRRLLLAVFLLVGCAEAAPVSTPVAAVSTSTPKAQPPDEPKALETVEARLARCADGTLKAHESSQLLQSLYTTHDPRGEACVIKALEDYRVDETEESVRWACRAVAERKLTRASAPLLQVFKKLHASSVKGAGVYRDVHDAMLALRDPNWTSELIGMLGRPMNPRDATSFKDEAFWQITSAELLGSLKSTDAIRPLMKMVLSPAKRDTGSTALLSLIKIGKPVLAPATLLLKGEDKELVAYARSEDARAPDAAAVSSTGYIGTAALILAIIGREEATPALLDVLGRTDELSRAVIARELPMLPKSPATLGAFQAVYGKLRVGLSLPPGDSAKESLLDASSMFFESNLVPWYIQSARSVSPTDPDRRAIQEATFMVSLKLMTVSQIGRVEDFGKTKTTVDGKPITLASGYEKELRIAKELVTACRSQLACYFTAMTDAESQGSELQFRGLKSAYMIGTLGGESTKQEIVRALPRLTNPIIRFVAVSAIDHLSPKGDTAVATALQKIVDDGEAAKNVTAIAMNAPLKMVIARLEAKDR